MSEEELTFLTLLTFAAFALEPTLPLEALVAETAPTIGKAILSVSEPVW